VVVVGLLIAAWCLGFAAVNLYYEASGRFAEGPHADYATGISVMSWVVLVLKLLGASVAWLSITELPDFVSPRALGVLVWGAAALLALYAAGSVAQAIGMMTGLTGSPDDITPAGIAYVGFFLFGALGFGVLARSFSHRHGIGTRTAIAGALVAPLVLGLVLAALPMLLARMGLLPR
jgi:hypothetical protein